MKAFVKMLCLLVLCPVLLAAGVQTLTIDSQLGTSIEDCFDRVAIGSQLPFNAIYRNISELTTRECEQLCKQDKQCQVYDYGVGAKGNATCELSNVSEKELLDNLPRHPDYDVYVRRIQCEQGPPSPLLPEFNDPEGPEHRPVFRPDDEPKRPLADDVASDLRPFEAQTRPLRPYSNHLNDERPDVYDGRPDFDRPPSYGAHRPQSIPYPEKPRPRPKPDPYDVLQFQNTYTRPHDGYWRPPLYDDHRPRPDPLYPPSPADDIPDIYGPKPIRPYPMEEKPVYQYIYRPHKKPYKPLQDDFGYGFPQKPNYPKPENDYPKPIENYPSKPDPYGSGPPYKPAKPVYNYPIKPDNPSYTYNDQYASNYGQGQYEDNSIHVEIHDPIKPQRPMTSKPIYENNYGQFHGSSQNSYSQTNQYTGTITEIDGYGQNQNRPYGYRPQKPVFDTPSYGASYSGYLSDGYGSQKPQKPQDPYPKPIYSDTSYGSHHDQPPYGSQSSNRPYGNQPSYDYTTKPGYNQPSNDRPDYVKPSFDKPVPSFGSSYGTNQAYDNNRPSYDTNRPTYGNNRPSNDEPVYESNRPNYNTKPSYGSNQASYGSNQNTYGGNQPTYGGNQPTYGGNQPTYGSNEPYKPENKPSYSTEEEDDKGYVNPSKKPNQTDGYNIKPVYEYDLDKPPNVPSYIVRPDGGIVTSRPVTVGDYGRPMHRPVYGDYEARRPGYGSRPVDYKACFRRVLAGKRALRSFVRRVVPCERLEDCRRECATEKRFHCESFNYKLDPSFRGKGLCELMTKPIEAFDVQRDFVEDKNYDFYEIDRNSLEPHCPESLRGAGQLHSGYLSSKPSNWVPAYEAGWRDRYDWNGHDGQRLGGRYPGNRRHDDRFYVPYQIGIARSNDDQETWGQYGGSYGGVESYYKDRTDYANSLSHWGLTSERPNFVPRPPFHFDYHNLGKKLNHWDNYGYGYNWRRNHSGSYNGLEYDRHYDEKPKVHIYDAEDGNGDGEKDCTSRRRPGMSLGSGAIRRALLARNVVECESACFNEQEFKCVSYSYRYSHSHGTDNCFLSERPYRGLELSADSGSDVYAMPQHSSCAVHTKPWVESECFWHVRSGASVYGAASRTALTVAGLGACEAECIRAHSFFCRGFSFRYDSPKIGDDIENCILTSSPPTSLDIGKGLKPTAGHELYSRGNYGRGCEPALYDDFHHKETQCYLQYDNSATLFGASVRGQARVAGAAACAAACTHAPFRCLSYSYNKHPTPTEDNCLLSEVRLFDLQRGVDYEHSNEHLLFAFDLFNSQCWRIVYGKTYEIPVPELPHPIQPEEHYPGWNSPSPGYSPQPAEPPYSPGSGPPSGPQYKPSYLPDVPEKPYLPSGPGPKPGYIPSGPELPYRPESKPGFINEPGHRPGFVHGPGYKPNAPPYLPEPHYPGPIEHEKPYSCSSCDNYPEPKPLYPESGFQPGFTLDPHRPDYIEPSGPNYPALPGRPSGPSYPGPPSRPSGPIYPGPPSRPSGSSYPLLPERPSGPSYPGGPSGPSYPGVPAGPSYPGPKPDVSVEPGLRPGYGGPSGPGPQGGRPEYPDDREIEPIAVSWRHYTVSGFPCRKGTSCAQNQVAGHWACEPEGGEIGSWDYCCAPTHRCGYSEGFHKPWCYVGRADDQWRPCSEKYYPYHQHNVPHPSQGHREIHRPNRPWRPSGQYIDDRDKPTRPYLSEADRKYWDDLYKNGPKAYYDKYGDPLPGYVRVPPVSRPHIKYHHNYQPPKAGQWAPAELDPPVPGGLGAPRFWPVAYLHKSPPPNMTYFRYNETRPTTQKYEPKYEPKYNPIPVTPPRPNPPPEFKKVEADKPNGIELENTKHRDEKTRNITNVESDVFDLIPQKETTTVKQEPKVTTTTEPVKEKEIVKNVSDVETIDPEKLKADQELANLKGIDDKLNDFSKSIEVLNIEDAKSGEKSSDLKTLEAEERQIEAIGRLFASRRGGKIVLEKRSQKDLEAKSIAIDKDYANINFGGRPTTERRGIIQKVTKDEIEKELNANNNNDRSLEVSETTYVRPPRVLSTTDNVRKAIVNGKIFYDATVRDQREILHNVTRRPKNLRPLEERAPSVITNNNYGKKKVVRARNVNPVRRVRRVYRRKYNPEEVRRRLLEREKNLKIENEQKTQ